MSRERVFARTAISLFDTQYSSRHPHHGVQVVLMVPPDRPHSSSTAAAVQARPMPGVV
jgi:hypothetical protein